MSFKDYYVTVNIHSLKDYILRSPLSIVVHIIHQYEEDDFSYDRYEYIAKCVDLDLYVSLVGYTDVLSEVIDQIKQEIQDFYESNHNVSGMLSKDELLAIELISDLVKDE